MLACLLAWNAAMALKQLRVARFEQFSFKPIISAERVWTPREFQTVEGLHKTLSLQMI